MALLKCTNLSVGYDTKSVVENLNFSLEEADYLCIVGENGAGKSTLMKTILGLLKPISGKIVYDEGLKKNEIGYLPQQKSERKDFPASVWEVVISGFVNNLKWKPFFSKKEKELAISNMQKMNILNLKNKSFGEISGGQQQRVLLARALCSTKKVILLDEPVSGLDPESTSEMYSLINYLNKQEGITVIMISHDINSSLNYCSKILHIGKEIFYGTKEEYFKSEIGKKFLGDKKDA